MALVTLEDGVVDYPLSKDMPLTGVWKYVPNSSGPVIRTKEDALDISRGSGSLDNQWSYLSIEHPLIAAGGSIIMFKIKYDVLQVSTNSIVSLQSVQSEICCSPLQRSSLPFHAVLFFVMLKRLLPTSGMITMECSKLLVSRVFV